MKYECQFCDFKSDSGLETMAHSREKQHLTRVIRWPERIWVFKRADGGNGWAETRTEDSDIEYILVSGMNRQSVEACFKCGWLSTTGSHTTCGRKPIRLYAL